MLRRLHILTSTHQYNSYSLVVKEDEPALFYVILCGWDDKYQHSKTVNKICGQLSSFDQNLSRYQVFMFVSSTVTISHMSSTGKKGTWKNCQKGS